MTSAMKAGVTDTLWTIHHIVKVVKLIDAEPSMRGLHKKCKATPTAG
ncbi:hypothetical protein BGCPKDLD_4164 [Methylorubrum suomiense]|uniref:Transposase n=1 Tax=Methylorubrum suomiense TaxID=144191 RepID=A0ABQ4V1Q2_9HYPH|nr:hypothetical protein BGCPKDLD_4164 [Methylorubrum suomiense]